MNEKFQLVPIQDIEKMARAVAMSKLFGMKTPEEAVALMLIAQSEGLHPARAAMEYHIINGKPSLKADAMLSRFQAAGGRVEWHDYTDKVCSGTFSHPQGGSVRVEWTIKMAETAKLTGNPTWGKFPRAMLRARVVSEAIRTVFPGVSVGMYTPEEVVDFEPEKPRAEPKDMGKAEVLPPDPPPAKPKMFDLQAALDAMCATTNELELKALFVRYTKEAKHTGDSTHLMEIAACKDQMKAKFAGDDGSIDTLQSDTL